MFVSAIIAAAGKGTRMNSDLNKQYLMLAGRPVLAWSLDVYFASGFFQQVIVVVAFGEEDYLHELVLEPFFKEQKVDVVEGGVERQQSIQNALRVLDPRCDLVCIHDGARPLVTASLIEAAIQGASRWGAAVSAVPLKDTIKEESEGMVSRTIPRSALRAVQTPQCFKRSLLEKAYRKAAQDNFVGTDDAVLVERLGEKVCFSTGAGENIKITTPEDHVMAEALLKRRLEG